jgi:hypothetical protein
MLIWKIEIFDVEDMDVELPVYQLEASGVWARPDYVQSFGLKNCDAQDAEEDSVADSCLDVERMVDTAGVAPDFVEFECVERDIELYSRSTAYADTVTEQSKILWVSAGRSVMVLGWEEEVVVVQNMDWKVDKLTVKHTGLAFGKRSLERVACPATPAKNGYILENLDGEVLV